MYDVDFQTKNYERAMLVVHKLIPFDELYKDDLIPLYIATNQSEKALAVITEMNTKFGKSQERTQYKNQILGVAKNQKSDWQELSSFKNYLDSNEGDKAIESMNSIFSNSQIENKVKHRVLNEFLIFVSKNPKYEPDLQKAVLSFQDNKEVNTAMEIGKFFQKKNQLDIAIKYYELALNKTNNVEINLLLLQAYTALQQFQKAEQKATDALELYPAQAELYYYLGLAKNQLQHYAKAKEVLETGLDFVIDNLDLEINFNLQLAEAYNGLGDFKKKELYFARANQLVKQKK
jgi:tetratricopeptide (TPR) repeat protein